MGSQAMGDDGEGERAARPASPASIPSSLSSGTTTDDSSSRSHGVAPVPVSPPPQTPLSLSTATVKLSSAVNVKGSPTSHPRLLASIAPSSSPPTTVDAAHGQAQAQAHAFALDLLPDSAATVVVKANHHLPPFFSKIEITPPYDSSSPTTYQFPIIAAPLASSSSSSSSAAARPNHSSAEEQKRSPTTNRHRPRPSLSRTPSPPTAGSASAIAQTRPVRTRRQSTQVYGSSAPVSAGKSSAAGVEPSNQLEAKVVILGSQGVGKTSIVHRFTTGVFSYSLTSTIGASFLAKRLVVDGCKVRLQIWDTAGQERFRSMAPLYYRGALAAILVYDITNEASFLDIRLWMEELRRNMAPDLVIHVVGSKLDLTGKRQVSLLDAQRKIAQWADELDRAEDERLNVVLSTRDRDGSPPSPSRSRASTRTRRGSILGAPSALPTIFTTAPAASPLSNQATPDSLGARVRKMSTKLGGLPAVATMAAASGGPASVSGSGGNSSSASSTTEALGLSSEGMSRSGSKMSISLGSLGLAGRSRSRNEEEERRAAEDAEREEMARIDRLVSECAIEVSEVSAKDDIGVEEMFVHITQRLVERKAQIESARILRSRDSIMLRDESPDPAVSGWCCT